MLPVVREDVRDVRCVQRFILVGEPDPALELRVAGELSVKTGHLDHEHAQVAAAEEVP